MKVFWTKLATLPLTVYQMFDIERVAQAEGNRAMIFFIARFLWCAMWFAVVPPAEKTTSVSVAWWKSLVTNLSAVFATTLQ